MSDEPRENPRQKVFPEQSATVREAHKGMYGSADFWRPSKEIKKFVKFMAEKLSISESLVIDKAIRAMYSIEQPIPPAPEPPPSKKTQKRKE